MSNKSIILLSGGIDSFLVLLIAQKMGRECHTISFDYNQRHKAELKNAAAIANYCQVSHKIIKIDPNAFSKTSLMTKEPLPKNRSAARIGREGIPSTYVPARNTIFLAFAMGQAEIIDAQEIYYGANALDILPYPDCSPKYIATFQSLMEMGTRQAREGHPPRLVTPLIEQNKVQIIKLGVQYELPFEMTMSCYDPKLGKHCGVCDACMLRREGFKQSSVVDPTKYRS